MGYETKWAIQSEAETEQGMRKGNSREEYVACPWSRRAAHDSLLQKEKKEEMTNSALLYAAKLWKQLLQDQILSCNEPLPAPDSTTWRLKFQPRSDKERGSWRKAAFSFPFLSSDKEGASPFRIGEACSEVFHARLEQGTLLVPCLVHGNGRARAPSSGFSGL